MQNTGGKAAETYHIPGDNGAPATDGMLAVGAGQDKVENGKAGGVLEGGKGGTRCGQLAPEVIPFLASRHAPFSLD